MNRRNCGNCNEEYPVPWITVPRTKKGEIMYDSKGNEWCPNCLLVPATSYKD